MKFAIEKDDLFEAVDRNLITFTKVRDTILSDKFRKLLESSLAVGNYLNGTNSKGGAWAIKLESVTKLSGIRGSTNPKVNALVAALLPLKSILPIFTAD